MKKKLYLFAIASLFATSTMFAQTSKTFVIDAGHGGFDKGSNNGNIVESEYSLELAQKIQQLAKKKNINVILTRDGNDFLDLQSRVDKMHELNPELIISLHLNNAMNNSLKGAEVFIKKDNTDSHTEKIGTELAQLVSINSIENRGLKKANFKILRDSKVPTFLIELGFASNPTDAETLKSAYHKNQLAEKIVQFLENYQSI
ncbi:N-acetylmuramoyl-L-alanine amidase [Empedobacter falsenii]|mgnify:CR=1 FL=1|uniref:N-acetylmuramoyl-L-alanine amidase n=1 Tax=Empedobacter falsenii TaxID=343874 RepID=A0A376G7D6_9FLAO|nr:MULTISPECIES: N-acetylmuramoyl-L-alanine amidase [Empedobacter]MDM1042076.1 N-acetylmuramoyl-L-alanine amidase [Empedobacter brevis]MDM1136049.1 N-acetylmuramoyl-L-alanine amidase [Empedobacter sp. R750]STD55588.1 N-acetylmuramoyl-L-alanine amidase LytC precursor [Empedobacter falsenii]